MSGGLVAAGADERRDADESSATVSPRRQTRLGSSSSSLGGSAAGVSAAHDQVGGEKVRPDQLTSRSIEIDDEQRQLQSQSKRREQVSPAKPMQYPRRTLVASPGDPYRPIRRPPMACLEDIPKYSFGTSHDILNHDDQVTQGANHGDQARETGPGHRNPEQPRMSSTNFKRLVAHAISRGCRHFDCAPLYGTQSLVGECLKESSSELPRQHFFVTSKLPPNMMRAVHIERSITKSISELQCCYLDLFLIHAPFATRHLSDDNFYPKDEQGNLLLDEAESILENAWRKLVELKRRGLTRYIGVSNVNMEQLVRLQAIHQIDVVQNEYHIYNQNRDLLDFCEEIDVHFEAYACFGNPPKCKRDSRPCSMSDPIVRQVARRNSLSVAQTVIQWIHHQPLSYVIKCDNERQLDENLEATRLAELPVEDLIELDSLDRGCRVHTFAEHRGLSRHREYPFKIVPP